MYNIIYMDQDTGGLSSSERQRRTAAEIARRRVLAAYSSTVQNLKNLPTDSSSAEASSTSFSHNSPSHYQSRGKTINRPASTYAPQTPYTNQDSTNYQNFNANQNSANPQSYANYQDYTNNQAYYSDPAAQNQNNYYSNPPSNSTATPSSFKDTPINTATTNEEWKKYHSAWQDYYKNYYSDYYSKAAQTYLATEKMKNERAASGKLRKARNFRRAIPAVIVILIILTGLFLQYNRLIFAPIMAYIVPDSGESNSITAVDPTVSQNVSPDPRLIIPKLNIDVPVAFSIHPDEVMEAMNYGVAQFSIPGANALPGQIGNLVISGHSAGDIYSNNQYKFIFSGLERLVPGDLIYVNYESTRYTYQVTGDQTVEPTDVAALIYDTDKPVLTLITCTPLGTSRYRLLVSAEQISPSYNDATVAEDDDASAPTDAAMPANSPSFFESIFGGNN